jgi:hypothetical protein
MANPTGFTPWLNGHVDQKNAIGDLARRVANDPHWPNAANLETYLEYLQEQGAPPELERTLLEAWAAFQTSQR